MTTHVGSEPSLGGDHRAVCLSGAEPQLGGDRRQLLPLLDLLSRGLWSSAEELRRVINLIPSTQRSAYGAALLARLEAADPGERLPEVKPWRGGRDQRVRIITSLSILGDPSVGPTLTALITDTNGEVRHAAMSALGRLKDCYAIPQLCNVVGDADVPIQDRLVAVDALAAIGGSEVETRLIEALKMNLPAIVMRRTVNILGILHSQLAVSTIIHLLVDSQDEIIRCEAALSLGRIKDIRALFYLWHCLDDEIVSLRRAAVHAIGEFPGEIARAALSFALSDADPQVHQFATDALRKRRIEHIA